MKETDELKLLIGINIDGYHRILKLLEGDKTHIEHGFDGCCLQDNPIINIPDYSEGTIYTAKLNYYVDQIYETGEIDFEYRIVDTSLGIF